MRDDPLMNWPLRGPCQIVPRARARVADRSFAIFKQEGRAAMLASEPTVRFYYGLLYGRYCDEESSSLVDDDLVPLCLHRVGSRVRITLRYREAGSLGRFTFYCKSTGKHTYLTQSSTREQGPLRRRY